MAISAGPNIPDADPGDRPDLSQRNWQQLQAMASKLRTQAREDGDPDVTAEIAEVMRACAQAIPAADPDRPRVLYRLAQDLDKLFDATNDEAIAQEAISTCREALATVAQDPKLRADLLQHLAICLLDLFLVSPDPALLREGEQLLSDAFAALPEGDSDRVECLAYRAMFLLTLYEFTGQQELLEDAAAIRGIISELPSDQQDEANSVLAGLGFDGEILRLRHDQTGSPDAIRDAVITQRAALAGAPDDDPDRALQRYAFMNALLREYERTSNLELIAEAASAGRKAVAAPLDAETLALLLSTLCAVLTRLFERTGDETVAAEAIDRGRAAVEIPLPRTHLHTHQVWLNYSVAMLMVGVRTGDLELLRQAVEAGRTAVTTAPRLTRIMVSRSATSGSRRTRSIRSLQDLLILREGITALRSAVAILPPGAPNITGSLMNLATTLARIGPPDQRSAGARRSAHGGPDGGGVDAAHCPLPGPGTVYPGHRA